MTPAGDQFCKALVRISNDLKNAIEDGRRFHSKYTESLHIAIPLRSSIYFLPQIMKEFASEFPNVSVQILYIYGNERTDALLRGEVDLIFGLKRELNHIPYIELHHLFDSHIYLITNKDDPLSKLSIITSTDLKGRTLMVGGGSPYELRKAQQQVMNTVDIHTINSRDHMTTLTNIAAGLGVCLSPGFCNDHLGEFDWTPFDTDEAMECVYASQKDDHRKFLQRFIEITQTYYHTSAIQL